MKMPMAAVGCTVWLKAEYCSTILHLLSTNYSKRDTWSSQIHRKIMRQALPDCLHFIKYIS